MTITCHQSCKLSKASVVACSSRAWRGALHQCRWAEVQSSQAAQQCRSDYLALCTRPVCLGTHIWQCFYVFVPLHSTRPNLMQSRLALHHIIPKSSMLSSMIWSACLVCGWSCRTTKRQLHHIVCLIGAATCNSCCCLSSLAALALTHLAYASGITSGLLLRTSRVLMHEVRHSARHTDYS